jgi:hypothetical protein
MQSLERHYVDESSAPNHPPSCAQPNGAGPADTLSRSATRVTTVKQSRSAAVLLDALITTHGLTATLLATELAVSVSMIDDSRMGAEPIPLERQLHIAVYAARYPALAREAHRLRSQVLAALAVEARALSSTGSVGTTQRWWR